MSIGYTDGEEVQEVRDLLTEFTDVFATAEKEWSSLPGTEHKVEVKDDTPIRQRAYNADIKSQETIDKTVEELLAQGIIEVSESEWSSPVILVKKKDGSSRMCVDYRKLNRVLKKGRVATPKD